MKCRIFFSLAILLFSLTTHAEVLVYRAVEVSLLTGNSKFLALRVLGHLAIDWEQNTAAYIGSFYLRTNKLYFVEDNIQLLTRQAIARSTAYATTSYTFLEWNYQRFFQEYKEFSKGLDYTLTTSVSNKVRFPLAFRGVPRAVLTDFNNHWVGLEGTTVYAFLPLDTKTANQNGQTSQQFIRAMEDKLKTQGFRAAPTDLTQLLSLF